MLMTHIYIHDSEERHGSELCPAQCNVVQISYKVVLHSDSVSNKEKFKFMSGDSSVAWLNVIQHRVKSRAAIIQVSSKNSHVAPGAESEAESGLSQD